MGNNGPKTYSKYGKSKSGQSDIIATGKYESVSDDEQNDEQPESSGGCCIVM